MCTSLPVVVAFKTSDDFNIIGEVENKEHKNFMQ